MGERAWHSILARCRFDDTRQLRSLVLEPIRAGGIADELIAGGPFSERDAPHRGDAATGAAILDQLKALSATMGVTIRVDDGQGTVHPAR